MLKLSHRKQLGNTGLMVSPVCMGLLPMGPAQKKLTQEQISEVVLYGLSRGINFIDTAQYYQTSHFLKEALQIFKEENPSLSMPIISSKSLASGYDEMLEAVHSELEQTGLSSIDIFLLHEVRSGQLLERKEALKALISCKEKGLVKAIGLSTHHVDVVLECVKSKEFSSHIDVVFPLINFKSMGIRKGNGPASCDEMREAILQCSKAGIGVFSMKAFGGGNLTSQYQAALNYVFSIDEIDSVAIGFSSVDEIRQLESYLDGTMPPDFNPDVSEKKMYVNQEDCLGCGSCLKACSSNAISYNKNGLAQISHQTCVTCGYCAQACPYRAIIFY